MRVLLVGDTHGMKGCAQAAVTWALKKNVELIIQLGDFAYNFEEDFMAVWQEAPVPVYFLRGNHDNANVIKFVWGPLAGDVPRSNVSWPNVTYLPDGCRVTIGDSRVVVMGGAVSIDRRHRVEDVGWWREEPTQMSAVMDVIYRSLPAHVMLSHDVPDCPPEIGMLIRGYKDDPCSTANRKNLRAVFDAVRPSRVFHGHYHHPYEEEYLEATFCGLDMDGPAALKVVDF